MSSYTTYGKVRSFGTRTYRVSGFSSPEEAEFAVMAMAMDDGERAPPALRERWWQFWRPTEHTELQKKLIARGVKK